MLLRKHFPAALIKGWNAHLNRFSKDKITNYSRLRQWFRRMLHWAICNPIQFQYAKREKQWVPKAQICTNSVQTNPPKVSEGEHVDTPLSIDNLQGMASRSAQSNLSSSSVVNHFNAAISFEHHQGTGSKQVENNDTDITFDSILEKLCVGNELPIFLEPHALTLLSLGKKRRNYATQRDLSCSEKCLRCLQCFMQPLSLAKHQGSKECDKAKFILEYIQFIQKRKVLQSFIAIPTQNSNTTLVSDTEKEQGRDADNAIDVSSSEPDSPLLIPSELQQLVQDFQSFPLSADCLYFDEKGSLRGALIDKLHSISQQSVLSSKCALQTIQNVQITKSVLENLLTGICSDIFPFSLQKAWLTDIPIDAMQMLINSKLQELPDKWDRGCSTHFSFLQFLDC